MKKKKEKEKQKQDISLTPKMKERQLHTSIFDNNYTESSYSDILINEVRNTFNRKYYKSKFGQYSPDVIDLSEKA